MRQFNFSKTYPTLLTPEIVALVGKIHEYKGEQALFIEAKADTDVYKRQRWRSGSDFSSWQTLFTTASTNRR